MRIAFISFGAMLGLVVAGILGPPRGYWNDVNGQQIVAWVLWTFGCLSAGALSAFLIHAAKSAGIRPRFSLRTMFVLTTIVSLWLGYHLNWIRQRRDAREWITAHRGMWGLTRSPNMTPVTPLSLRWLGEEGVGYIYIRSPTFEDVFIHDHKLAEMRELFPEAWIDGIDNVIQRPAKP